MLQPHPLLTICHLVQLDSGAPSLPTASTCLLTSRQHHPMAETPSAAPTESQSAWEHALLILVTARCGGINLAVSLPWVTQLWGVMYTVPRGFLQGCHTCCPLWLWLMSHSCYNFFHSWSPFSTHQGLFLRTHANQLLSYESSSQHPHQENLRQKISSLLLHIKLSPNLEAQNNYPLLNSWFCSLVICAGLSWSVFLVW